MKRQEIPGIKYVLVNKEGRAVFCGSSTDQCVGDFAKRFSLGIMLGGEEEGRFKRKLREMGWSIYHARGEVTILGKVEVF